MEVYEKCAKYEVNPETVKFLKDHFKSKDVTKTGHLTLDELEECLKILGFEATSDSDLLFLKKHLDRDGNGKLEIDELLENVHFINYHILKKDMLMKAFKKFDLDGDGHIRLPELEKVLLAEGMPVEEEKKLLTHLVKKYDKNFDGKFDYTEFVELAIVEDHDFLQNLEKYMLDGEDYKK